MSPYDTPMAGVLRFIIEVVAWVAGPWAVADLTGQGWTAIPTAIVLIGIPAVFSTTGDKNQVVIATPGPVRLLIEILLHAVAIAGAFVVWPGAPAVVVAVIALASLGTGWQRSRWLLRGAPIET